MNSVILTPVMELLKTQMRITICWYFIMLKMEIYITIYQGILKKLLGKIKSIHFIVFHWGKVLIFYYLAIPIDHVITAYLFIFVIHYFIE